MVEKLLRRSQFRGGDHIGEGEVLGRSSDRRALSLNQISPLLRRTKDTSKVHSYYKSGDLGLTLFTPTAAALVFIVYDICANLDDELKYIWSSKWTFPKALYLFNRYYGLFLVTICEESVMLAFREQVEPTVESVGSKLYKAAADISCIIRVSALYNNKPKADFIFPLYGSVRWANLVGRDTSPNEAKTNLAGCGIYFVSLSGELKRHFIAAWVLAVSNAAHFLVLSLAKLWMSAKDMDLSITYTDWSDPSCVSPLLVAIVRNGVFEFVQLTGIQALCLFLSLYRGNGFFFPLVWPWMFAMYSYTGCRLILNCEACWGPDPLILEPPKRKKIVYLPCSL
ncbi:hypothetical protein DFP72DRAFT_1095613 [Ephemerocybe angulata]|uniref:DUF6533 domain-containing protein n=1 Tax=Ephemerocybe angulata TaxID=980116 RepID=A0A8H6LVF8_9AGAR|nr:hypothetical protein DFP72DRAFT_1095613 [Tulosesus angulatus]